MTMTFWSGRTHHTISYGGSSGGVVGFVAAALLVGGFGTMFVFGIVCLAQASTAEPTLPACSKNKQKLPAQRHALSARTAAGASWPPARRALARTCVAPQGGRREASPSLRSRFCGALRALGHGHAMAAVARSHISFDKTRDLGCMWLAAYEGMRILSRGSRSPVRLVRQHVPRLLPI